MNNYFLSENCFVYSISENLSINDNLNVIRIYKDIYSDKEFRNYYNITDIVPAYNSIAFHHAHTDHIKLKEAILRKIIALDNQSHIESKIHIIEVRYDGIDLQQSVKRLGITVEQLISKHTSTEYHIAMLGFKPYFPYLLGLDKSISIPRLKTPRNRIDVGSIGIGGSQTTVFTTDSPSGWNIIGNTNFRNFSDFSPGDKIIFKEV